MRIIIISTMLLISAGCKIDTSGDHEIKTDPIEIGPISVDIVKTEVKQVNGIFYVRSSIEGQTIDCMAVSPSTLYSSEWSSIPDADLKRVENYSSEEIIECL